MVGARVRRQQVAYTRSRGLSDRRACAVLSVARSTLGYQSRLAVRDAPALTAMRCLAAQYPRYGYRRIRIFLRREGHVMSPIARIGSGARLGYRSRGGAPGAGWPRDGPGRCRRPPGTTCGRTTSCSTPVRIGRRSNA